MKIKLIALLLAFALVAYACDSSSSSDPEEDIDELVGAWVSEGVGNVAPGLAILVQTARIDAEFFENQTYSVVSVDSSGAAVNFEGNWVAGEPNEEGIRTITLNQSVPTTLTSSGIFRVDGDQMTYEVIQSSPALDGVTPPTPEGGFGSTIQGGQQAGPLWIQRYERDRD